MSREFAFEVSPTADRAQFHGSLRAPLAGTPAAVAAGAGVAVVGSAVAAYLAEEASDG